MLETAAEGSVDTKVPGVEITLGSNMATEGMESGHRGGKVVGTETAEATAMIGTTIGDTKVAVATPVAQTETATVPSLDLETGQVGTDEGTTIKTDAAKSTAKTITTTIATKEEELLREVIWTGDIAAETNLP